MLKTHNSKFNISKIHSTKHGALLLELLIVISILAVILGVGTQAVYVSMQSGKVSGERDVALGLAGEALEAVRAVSDERWQNVYDLTGKGSTHYKTVQSGGKWTISSGDETIVVNGISFTRYVIIDNVSRDASTRLIDTGTNYDPSTQKATVTVNWPNADSVVANEYLLRWRNKTCAQTSWSGGAGSGVKNCPDTTYVSKEAAISTAGGTLQVQ